MWTPNSAASGVLKQAIFALYGQNLESQSEANVWLQNFSHTSEAWSACLTLLSERVHQPQEILFFTLNMLLSKSRIEWHKLSSVQQAQIFEVARNHLVEWARTSPPVSAVGNVSNRKNASIIVMDRLVLLVAATAVRRGSEETGQICDLALAMCEAALSESEYNPGADVALLAAMSLLSALVEEAAQLTAASAASSIIGPGHARRAIQSQIQQPGSVAAVEALLACRAEQVLKMVSRVLCAVRSGSPATANCVEAAAIATVSCIKIWYDMDIGSAALVLSGSCSAPSMTNNINSSSGNGSIDNGGGSGDQTGGEGSGSEGFRNRKGFPEELLLLRSPGVLSTRIPELLPNLLALFLAPHAPAALVDKAAESLSLIMGPSISSESSGSLSSYAAALLTSYLPSPIELSADRRVAVAVVAALRAAATDRLTRRSTESTTLARAVSSIVVAMTDRDYGLMISGLSPFSSQMPSASCAASADMPPPPPPTGSDPLTPFFHHLTLLSLLPATAALESSSASAAVNGATLMMTCLQRGQRVVLETALNYLLTLNTVPVLERLPDLGKPIFAAAVPMLIRAATYPRRMAGGYDGETTEEEKEVDEDEGSDDDEDQEAFEGFRENLLSEVLENAWEVLGLSFIEPLAKTILESCANAKSLSLPGSTFVSSSSFPSSSSSSIHGPSKAPLLPPEFNWRILEAALFCLRSISLSVKSLAILSLSGSAASGMIMNGGNGSVLNNSSSNNQGHLPSHPTLNSAGSMQPSSHLQSAMTLAPNSESAKKMKDAIATNNLLVVIFEAISDSQGILMRVANQATELARNVGNVNSASNSRVKSSHKNGGFASTSTSTSTSTSSSFNHSNNKATMSSVPPSPIGLLWIQISHCVSDYAPWIAKDTPGLQQSPSSVSLSPVSSVSLGASPPALNSDSGLSFDAASGLHYLSAHGGVGGGGWTLDRPAKLIGPLLQLQLAVLAGSFGEIATRVATSFANLCRRCSAHIINSPPSVVESLLLTTLNVVAPSLPNPSCSSTASAALWPAIMAITPIEQRSAVFGGVVRLVNDLPEKEMRATCRFFVSRLTQRIDVLLKAAAAVVASSNETLVNGTEMLDVIISRLPDDLSLLEKCLCFLEHIDQPSNRLSSRSAAMQSLNGSLDGLTNNSCNEDSATPTLHPVIEILEMIWPSLSAACELKNSSVTNAVMSIYKHALWGARLVMRPLVAPLLHSATAAVLATGGGAAAAPVLAATAEVLVTVAEVFGDAALASEDRGKGVNPSSSNSSNSGSGGGGGDGDSEQNDTLWQQLEQCFQVVAASALAIVQISAPLSSSSSSSSSSSAAAAAVNEHEDALGAVLLLANRLLSFAPASLIRSPALPSIVGVLLPTSLRAMRTRQPALHALAFLGSLASHVDKTVAASARPPSLSSFPSDSGATGLILTDPSTFPHLTPAQQTTHHLTMTRLEPLIATTGADLVLGMLRGGMDLMPSMLLRQVAGVLFSFLSSTVFMERAVEWLVAALQSPELSETIPNGPGSLLTFEDRTRFLKMALPTHSLILQGSSNRIDNNNGNNLTAAGCTNPYGATVSYLNPSQMLLPRGRFISLMVDLFGVARGESTRDVLVTHELAVASLAAAASMTATANGDGGMGGGGMGGGDR